MQHDPRAGTATGRQLASAVAAGVAPCESEARFRSLVQHADHAVVVCDGRGTIVYANPACERVLGYRADELVGKDPRRIVDAADRARLRALHRGMRAQPGAHVRAVVAVAQRDGRVRRIEVVGTDLRHEPAVGGLVVTCHDATERVEADEARQRSEAELRLLVEHLHEVVFKVGPDGCFTFLNPAWERILGHPVETTLGRPYIEFMHPDDRPGAVERQRGIFSGTIDEVRREVRYLTASGEHRWMQVWARRVAAADGSTTGTAGTLIDVTERRRAEARLAHQASHDPLTNLANRATLIEFLDAALDDPERRSAVAVLFIDLDHFKVVNDSLGHDAGDALLASAARRLRSAARADDLVARFGGDEFVVACRGVQGEDDARSIAARFADAVGRPVVLRGRRHALRASIGIALAPVGRPAGAAALVRDADLAMYRAKEFGRDRAEVFTADLRARAHERLDLTDELDVALRAGHVEAWFQPVVAAASRRVVGFEALARWRHPTRGVIPPAAFLPHAEATGRMPALGHQVLARATEAASCWGGPWPMPSIGVNFSAGQLGDPSLCDDIAAALALHGIAPHRFVVELTESTLMADQHRATLERLASLGVKLALDDFGTGYSSLAYLRDLPVHIIKVDRSFVARVASSGRDRALVAAMIGLGRELGLHVVAEGVETEEQFELVSGLGCGHVQGFLFGHPVPARHVPALLRAGPAPRC